MKNMSMVAALTVIILGGCGGGESSPTTPGSPAGTPASPPTGPGPTTATLSITIEGSGTVTDGARGISCASSCTTQLAIGSTVNLAPAAPGGFVFEGWSGSCTGNGGCTITMQAAASVAARFTATGAGPANGGSLFDAATGAGTVAVTLHPGSQVVLGQTTKVAFGVPLPRGLVTSTDMLRLTDAAGSEIASTVRELARWQTIGAGGGDSIRAALFHVDVVFQSRAPQVIRVAYGAPRSLESGGTPPEPTTLWTSIANGPVPDEYPSADDVREPIVYATLPAEWLGRTLLVTRTTPTGESAAFGWWDSALVNYARTAVNDVAATVLPENRIDLIAEEPWLYDRALALFTVYLRTGDVKWLRHAHRAAQWYAKKVGPTGIFLLSSYDADLKYSYGMSLLTDYLLTGDESLRAPIDRVAQAGVREWETTYGASLGFWTERHHAYALLAASSAFELTGDPAHAQRATALADLTVQMSQNAAGCPLHTVEQHEGDANDLRQMCSPWMGALLAQAMLRYYILSEDPRVLEWLSGMGDYVVEHALYDGGIEHPELAGRIMPWYLAGPTGRVEDGRGWGDMEHACDIAGLMAKATWAKRRLGQDHSAVEQATDDLLATCQFVLDYWHRSAPQLAEYRLAPPRKFSWWFGSSSDLAWMLGR